MIDTYNEVCEKCKKCSCLEEYKFFAETKYQCIAMMEAECLGRLGVYKDSTKVGGK